MNDLVALTIREAGNLLAHRHVSAADLIEATLERIATTEGRVHAYARIMSDSARREASERDAELMRGIWRGPLHGIPIAVKDVFHAKGVPTEAGSQVLRGFTPEYDSGAVSRLREAGAIIVGKTITHEFAYGQDVPPTRNAWDERCFPGGSSAGSGVAVAVRSGFGAIGTDTGGSVRVPASINGVVGLKPTHGRISCFGVIPISTSLDTVGPITRTVEDCGLMLEAMSGYDPRDASSLDEPVPRFVAGLEVGVDRIRLGVDRQFFFSGPMDDEVRSSVEGVLREYEAMGATITEVRIPELELTVPTGMPVMLADMSTRHRRLLREHRDEYVPATRIVIELGELIPATHYVLAQTARSQIRRRLRQAFDMLRLDALIAPTVPILAVPSSFDLIGAIYMRYGFPANVIGLPAITVPCGFSAAGLPIGFQVIGRPLQEAQIMSIARCYEREHDWYEKVPEGAAALGEQ